MQMPRREIWTRRFLLFGLGVLSLALPFIHYRFLQEPIERYHEGGMHPADLLGLRDFGTFSRWPPGVVLTALIVSFLWPRLTRPLLILCTTGYIVYITAYLFQCLMAVAFHISP